MAAARPEPTTPRKKRADSVDNIIATLNHDYNVAIQLPDKSLTPSHRRERAKFDPEYDRCDKIYRGIHFLYFQSEEELQRVLHVFHFESKAASQKWVRKPRAGLDVLPSSSDAYRASTPGERLELQTILLDTIDLIKTSLQPLLPSSTSTVVNGQHGSLMGPPQPLAAKRPSCDGLDASTKRARGDRGQAHDEPQQLFAAIDHVPVRHKVTTPRLGAATSTERPAPTQKSLDRSFYNTSVNTSKVSMVSSVFSEQAVNDPPATQSTVDASIDDTSIDKRKRLTAAGSSQDSLMPSSGVLRALNESFSRFREHEVVESAVAPLETRQHSPSPENSTIYSSVSGMLDVPMPDPQPISPKAMSRPTSPKVTSKPTSLDQRLQSLWPTFPPWLHKAPLAVAWEITRIALHCNVDLADINLQYDSSWDHPGSASLKSIRTILYHHPAFSGKSFPEAPSASSWDASFDNFQSRDMVVVFSMSIDFSPMKTGPLFLVQMHPSKLDKGCRLSRHFGPGRFLEVLMPSPCSRRSPLDEEATENLIHWLTRTRHSIIGREWRAFFTSDGGQKTPPKQLRISLDIDDAKPTYQDRVHFFAERGVGFDPRDDISVSKMLNWLLNFNKNKNQSHLKLFSRIKLGLSKTQRSMVFEHHQIHHRKSDKLSPIGNVMNDGVARMSLSVARHVRDTLGLSDIPSAIQGRIGSAKGMWIIDVNDDGFEHWIETFPSQRKWVCDDQADPDHRTLEVHSVATELTSASLNLQFLPVLENRAANKQQMREVIASKLVKGLEDELGSQKTAMKGPLQFKSWVTENSSSRFLRVQHGQVPFLGGLPIRDEDAIIFLLDGGFDPRKQRYIQDLSWKIQEKRCEQLKTKLNISVGRSAYIYMVVDFLGVLREGEVHIGFSTKFQAENFSATLLHGTDILVARSPAHFISDIQKVKAVFKPELQALRDVIVFSREGDIPLADKLSGGDYDGDKAWVCWDPDIVDNFVNAEVPPTPDLSKYITRDLTTFKDLEREVLGHTAVNELAVDEMIERSFKFNMRQSYLGICTNYKEKLCYQKNRVDDEASIILSTLLSNLVDQAKQGIVFGQQSWDRLCQELLGQRRSPKDPAYKKDTWTGGEPVHIIDWLKFSIAAPTIERELKALHESMKPSITGPGIAANAEYWDEDLVEYYNDFEAMVALNKSRSSRSLLDGLKDAIAEVFDAWAKAVTKDKSATPYAEKVDAVYQKWCAIKPVFKGRSTLRVDSKVVALLTEPYLSDPELSRWALLKASYAFKLYYMRSGSFIWRMAGRQLQFIKAMVSNGRGGMGVGGPIPIVPSLYAGVGPDKKFVKQFLASLEGSSTGYISDDDDDMEDDT